MRKVIVWISGILVFLVVYIITLVVLLTTPPITNLLVFTAEKYLKETGLIHVEIESLQINLLNSLKLRGLKVFSPDEDNKFCIVEIEKLDAKYSLGNLHNRQFFLESAVLNGLNVDVRQDSTGEVILPFQAMEQQKVKEKQSKPPDFSLLVGKAELKNANLEYSDSALPLNTQLQNLKISLVQPSPEVYSFELAADTLNVSYQGIDKNVSGFFLTGQMEGTDLNIDSLSFSLPGLSLNTNAEIDLSSDLPGMVVKTGMFIDAGILTSYLSEFIPQELPEIYGNVIIQVGIEGNPENPNVNVKVDIPFLEVMEYSIKNGSLKARYDTTSINLDRLYLEIFSGNINLDGNVELENNLPVFHDLNLDISNMDINEAVKKITNEPIDQEAKLSGSLHSRGKLSVEPEVDELLNDISLAGEFKITELSNQGNKVNDLKFNLGFKNGQLTANLEQDSTTSLTCLVDVTEDSLDGKVDIDIANLAPHLDLAGVPGIQGGLKLSTSFSGALENPSAQVELSIGNLKYHQVPLDTLYADIYYDSDYLEINNFLFNGNLAFIDTLQPPFQGTGLQGSVGYGGQFEGYIDSIKGEASLKRLKGNLSISSENFGVDTLLLQTAGIDLSVGNDFIHLDSIYAEYNPVLLSGNGRISISNLYGDILLSFINSENHQNHFGRIDLEFNAADTSNLSLKATGSEFKIQDILAMFPEPKDVGGDVSFLLDFNGSPSMPEASASLSVDNPWFGWIELDSAFAVVSFSNDTLRISALDIYHVGQRTWADAYLVLDHDSTGMYTFNETCQTKGELGGRNLDLQTLNVFFPKGMWMTGGGNYRFNWDGTVKEPMPFGEITLIDGHINLATGAPPVEDLAVRIALDDSLITVRQCDSEIAETAFDFKGKLAYNDPKNLYTKFRLGIDHVVAIKGVGGMENDSLDFYLSIREFDLTRIRTFLPDIQKLKGFLKSELDFTGTVADPHIDGTLNVWKLAFMPPHMDKPLTNGVVSMRFNEKEVTLDTLYLRKRKGTILATAHLAHKEGQIEDLAFNANVDGMMVKNPREYKLTIESADVTYEKVDNHYELDGDIVLGDTRFQLNVTPKLIISNMETTERPREELPPILQKTQFYVDIHESEDVWIDNNLAKLNLGLDLKLRGRPDKPNMVGEVNINDGHVYYLGRKFRITKGIISFVDPTEPIPMVDLIAESTVRTYEDQAAVVYTVTLSIQGDADEPILVLTSDPPVSDEADIITLLTVGYTRERLTEKPALRHRAGEIGSQYLSGYINRNVGSAIGLDELSFEGNLLNLLERDPTLDPLESERESMPKLQASKRLTDRLTLTYITRLGYLDEQGVRVNYRLNRLFSVEGETYQGGEFGPEAGLDLNFRLQFK